MTNIKCQEKRLNLRLSVETDRKLREIAAKTGLKLVTIISQGIEAQYVKMEGKK